ncbi:MAG: alpha/beta hydrolase [Gammaproteobacteria bacterium AqS3]|nr:alpha/beta hydrolase [Gammaproteobacteria bacterium AqS3]
MSEPAANPQTRQVLDDLAAEPAFAEPDLARQRVVYDQIFSEWTQPVERPAPQRRVDCSRDGIELSLLLIEPPEARRTVVYLHGGGWALGSAECYAPLGQQLAQMLDAQVVLVDYPLAPEHTFPAAYLASCAAVGWAAENCVGELIIAGDSAGGQLAATTCLDAGVAGKLAGQLSIYPVIDLRQDADYPSRRQLGQGGWFLTEAGILGASAGYAGDADPGDPRLTPLTADSLAVTPPSVVYLPELDPLKDEGAHYAERLKADGVPVEVVWAEGTIHGCASFSKRIPSAQDALQKACNRLLGLVGG